MKENLGNACNNAIYMRPAEFTCERSGVTTDIYVAPHFSRFPYMGCPGKYRDDVVASADKWISICPFRSFGVFPQTPRVSNLKRE